MNNNLKMKNQIPEPEEIEIKKGTLYLVSTPIGNDDDITLRALKVLKNCDIVVCEEPKVGARTLHKYNLQQKMELLNEQNETEKTIELIEFLLAGKNLSLVSDCGTPEFADPGIMLVKEAIKNDIKITVVPGATSIMTALVRSGLSNSQFLYAGFLSRLKKDRALQLTRLKDEARTVVLLETPYRIMPLLEAAKLILPDRQAYIGCNLTMSYETHHYGTFSELYDRFSAFKFKGEFVICFEGATMEDISKPDADLSEYLAEDNSRVSYPKKTVYPRREGREQRYDRGYSRDRNSRDSGSARDSSRVRDDRRKSDSDRDRGFSSERDGRRGRDFSYDRERTTDRSYSRNRTDGRETRYSGDRSKNSDRMNANIRKQISSDYNSGRRGQDSFNRDDDFYADKRKSYRDSESKPPYEKKERGFSPARKKFGSDDFNSEKNYNRNEPPPKENRYKSDRDRKPSGFKSSGGRTGKSKDAIRSSTKRRSK